jgi:hypothetical protein
MTESHDLRALGPNALESLLAEIRRYLDVVDAFRSEGHGPRWRPEGSEKEVSR